MRLKGKKALITGASKGIGRVLLPLDLQDRELISF